jgi:di/tricarboxylate transporter
VTLEIIQVLIVLFAAVLLFVSEKFPIDMVAMMVLGAVLLLGLVTPGEAISGFSNPATITVGAVFVLSAGLQHSGAVAALGRQLRRFGESPVVLVVLIMVVVGGISAFINNTAAVAVFLPLVLALAARHKISPAKLLIPMSFASEFGGVSTLIGTSTNLLVSSISEQAGYGAFGMFEMGKLGLVLCVAGIVYLVVVGGWLLPERRGAELTEAYELGGYITELRVMKDSPLIGQTVREAKFGKTEDVTVLQLLRNDKRIWSPASEPLQEGDVLLVEGKISDLMEAKEAAGLEIAPEFELKDARLKSKELMLVEALIPPRSRLIGRTLASIDFKRRHPLIVLAIRRRETTLRSKLDFVRLRLGDELLLQGPAEEIGKLRSDENFIVMEEVETTSLLQPTKVAVAVGILALVVGLAALKVLPIVTTAIVGCIAMVLSRCIRLEEAYDAIDWRVIFLLGGVLPLGIAMEKTGAATLIADQTVGYVGAFGPVAVVAAFYVLTAVLTEAMSNNASAILLAPIAISTAVGMGISPKPLLMAVTFAASTSFATPVGYQTNMMIYNPGGYRFVDFMKVGIPLIGIFLLISVYLIPKIWPF